MADTIADLVVKVTADVNRAILGLDRVERKMNDVSNNAGRMSRGMRIFWAVVVAVATSAIPLLGLIASATFHIMALGLAGVAAGMIAVGIVAAATTERIKQVYT